MRGGDADVVAETGGEAGEGEQEADDEGGKRAEVEAVEEIVASFGRQGEEVRQAEVAAAEEEVVDQHDGDDGALEDGIPAEEVEEAVGCGDDTPDDGVSSSSRVCCDDRGMVEQTYQGTIAKAMTRHNSWPRMMLMYLGRRQVTSAANGMKLQAIEVPRVANAKLADAKKTPARALEEYDSSRIRFSRS